MILLTIKAEFFLEARLSSCYIIFVESWSMLDAFQENLFCTFYGYIIFQ